MSGYLTIMVFWRQLKWRIVAAQMLVVVVGVVVVLLMAYLATRYVVPSSIAEGVEALLVADVDGADVPSAEEATAALIDSFRRSLLIAVLVAGACALLAGIGTSLLLVREILRPLRQIGSSSRRIASGHYDERVPVPGSDELAQVAASFNEMAEELAQVEKTRVALIGDVSHELRTPLTSLSGYLEGVIDGMFPADDATMVMMLQEVRRMRRLVDDLQTLSRVEAGQISLHLEAYDVRLTIEQVVAQLQPQWQAQLLNVRPVLPTVNIMVYADPDRVAQILTNLLGNAMAYTAEGGEIVVSGAINGRFAQLSVQDSGAGIAPEYLPYLFERFFRADRSRARTSGGSGIGLTISRHLAWAMGGELSAYSAGSGRGSTFTLTLPLAVQG